ncbi:MAG: hypothetical protein GY878_29280 [Fuerstiella sp.]|nr:hypothetical protein [Fuerstiella sp.]
MVFPAAAETAQVRASEMLHAKLTGGKDGGQGSPCLRLSTKRHPANRLFRLQASAEFLLTPVSLHVRRLCCSYFL